MLENDLAGFSRRGMLKALAAAAASAAVPRSGHGAAPAWREGLVRYLQSLRRPDGGYGWEGQERGHLTPTFAAIGCCRLVGQTPPDKHRSVEFLRTHHPAQLKKLEQEHRLFDFEQIQSLVWLDEDVSDFRDRVGGWKGPLAYLRQYEQHGYPVFQSEAGIFVCRALVGLPADGAPLLVDYLDVRRRADGSFNNTPADDGSGGHVLNTWWGLRALAALGRLDEKKAETIAWLRDCQLAGGGFTYQPRAEIAGVDDAAYTWAAVRALQLLGAAPADRAGCVAWLRSLANADGGFGDRPGWLSNPRAAYYALDALDALGALNSPDLPEAAAGGKPRPKRALPADLNVFSIQLEAHGCGSPAEAVDLAGCLRIHLWGAKNAQPEWIERAQAIADAGATPVRFFAANEEYGTWVDVPGMGTYSHTSDIVAPAGSEIGPSLAGQGPVSWPEYRRRRLAPLAAGGGRLVWQFGENEPLVRLFLDDSLQRGGYAAISTFHFGNPDFTNSEPFLQRWRGQIPYVALQDAHGGEPWWFADMTTGFRTLFLAAEPTWEGWLRALEENWVVAVRRDAASGFDLWMHGGSSDVIEHVRRRQDRWRWWDNPGIARPLVSIVAVRPEDRFEAARPDAGVAVRVRCAWENTTQGLPKTPICELVRLLVDGAEVRPALTAVKARRGGALADHYHAFPIADPAPGRHTAAAAVRVVATGAEATRKVEFVV